MSATPTGPVAGFFANGIGDAILALPAVRELSMMGELTKVIVPRGRPFEVVFDEFSSILEPTDFDKDKEFSVRDIRRALTGMSGVAFFTTWMNESLRQLLAEPRKWRSVGLQPEFDESIRGGDRHYFNRYRDVARNLMRLPCNKDAFYPHSCQRWLSYDDHLAYILRHSSPYWVVHTDTLEWKVLPTTFWTDFFERLYDLDAATIIFVVGKAPRRFVQLSELRNQLIIVPPDFALSTYILTGAKRFIGVDSSFLHYADLQGIPSVGLLRGGAPVNIWGLSHAQPRMNISVPESDMPDASFVADAFYNLA